MGNTQTNTSRSSGVTSVFFRSSTQPSEHEDDDVFNLIKDIQGRTDITEHGHRPPIIKSFLDIDQGQESGILLVTTNRIENFSQKFGFRKWQRKYDKGGITQIVDCDFVPRRTPTSSSLIAIGFKNGRIEFLNSSNLQLHSILTTSIVEDLSLTRLSTPIDNVVICGYSDGSIRSFFINSQQLASIIPWPNEYFMIVNPFEAQNHTAIETYVPVQPDQFTLERRLCKVTSLGFHLPRNLLAAGYEGYKQLTNRTIDGQSSLVNLSPPVTLFSIESGSLLSTFEPIDATVIFTKIISLTSAVQPFPLFLLSLTSSSTLIIHRIPDASTFKLLPPPLRIRYPIFSVNLLNTPINQFNLGRCVDAAIDSIDAVLFVLFEFGFVASIALTISLPNSTAESTSPLPSSSEFLIDDHVCINDFNKDSGDDTTTPNPLPSIYTSLSYDEKTQTLMVGDAHSHLRLSPDIFGRYGATKTLRDVELDRLSTVALKQQNDQLRFRPTIYIGRQPNIETPNETIPHLSFFSSIINFNSRTHEENR